MKTTYVISLRGSKKWKRVYKKSEIPKKWRISKVGEVQIRALVVLDIRPTSSRSTGRDALDSFLASKTELADEKDPTTPPNRQQEVQKERDYPESTA